MNGGYTEWSDWGSCSSTCGYGLQTRSRFCINPPPSNGGTPCVGEDQEERKCGQAECPSELHQP